MEAKHTPGPWRFDDAGPLSGNIIRFDVLAGPESDPFRVCEIDDSAADVPLSKRKAAAARDLANARLVAAAPALLEACKEWAAFASTLERSTEPGDPIAEVRNRVHGARIAKTRAAIRKAEGGGE